MLYILLIIIAVGVLLASEAGQVLLRWLIILLVVGGLLYLAFWLIVLGVAFFNTDSGREVGGMFITGIFLVALGMFFVFLEGKTPPRIKKILSLSVKLSSIIFVGIGIILIILMIYLTPPL